MTAINASEYVAVQWRCTTNPKGTDVWKHKNNLISSKADNYQLMFYKRTCCENLKSWGRQTWLSGVHGRQFFAILAAVHSRAHARPTLSALSSVVDVRGRDKAAIRLKERERGEICRLLPTTWVQKFCTSAVLRATSNCHLWAHRGTRSVLKFIHD